MSGDYELNQVAGKWIVRFTRRSFERQFSSKADAEAVVRADEIYTEAERLGLYKPTTVDNTSREIGKKLRHAADDLEKLDIGDLTIREFRHVADILDPQGV